MSFVLLKFKQMQPLGLFETMTFNDAHIAISQYKHNQVLVFDRVPQVGELVSFLAPQGHSLIYFKVDEVQHLPTEVSNLPAATTTPRSVIFLQPILVQ